MDLRTLFHSRLEEHVAVVSTTRMALADEFARLATACIAAIDRGNKILLFGNGGSAADVQHIAAELVVRYDTNRAPIAAIALTTDTSVLTAAANDFSYEGIFARQVTALGKPGDVAIGLSTSGDSENVVRALVQARHMRIRAAALSGCGGGRLTGLADPLLVVPSSSTPRIQEMHIILGHLLCEAIEEACGRP